MQYLELLGTTLDSGLNFSDQIATNSKDTSRMIRVLMRPQKLTPTKVKLHAYRTAVLPLQYNSTE